MSKKDTQRTDSRIKHDNIPEDVRAGARMYVRLLKAGDPIPDYVRKLHNQYKRLARRGGGSAIKSNIIHTFIPERYRKANNDIARLKRQGKKPTPETEADAREYQRWLKHGGQPPPKRIKLEPDEVKWPQTAAMEWDRLINDGKCPGDIPQYIIDGRAKYLGKQTSKYTPCSKSDRKGGKGCRGMHGNGPKLLKYAPGVANCVRCQIGYRNVPEDVNRCGCCGGSLRKQKRFKS